MEYPPDVAQGQMAPIPSTLLQYIVDGLPKQDDEMDHQ